MFFRASSLHQTTPQRYVKISRATSLVRLPHRAALGAQSPKNSTTFTRPQKFCRLPGLWFEPPGARYFTQQQKTVKPKMADFEAILAGKYPAKRHAQRVVEWMRKTNPEINDGVLYLESQKTKMIEDNDEAQPFRYNPPPHSTVPLTNSLSLSADNDDSSITSRAASSQIPTSHTTSSPRNPHYSFPPLNPKA
jgi:hypothetical protein